MRTAIALLAVLALAGCATTSTKHDLVIRNGVIYDGSGHDPIRGDLAIDGDRVTSVGGVAGPGRSEIDAHGLAVAPGFINVMSQATESLIADGRGLSDLLQGVTTEIFGEGESMGPLTPAMKKETLESQADIHYDVEWTTLRQYLDWLAHRGVSPNIGSFLGGATPRIYVMGRANRAPTAEELTAMKKVVSDSMDDGAFGLASALIYAPGVYAKTDELIAL